MNKDIYAITSQFKNTYVMIGNKGPDEELQKAFFAMGFRWSCGGREVCNEARTYISVNEHYYLAYTQREGVTPNFYDWYPPMKEVTRDAVIFASEEVKALKRKANKESKKRRAKRRWDATTIKHVGDKCPVAENVVVSVKLEDGEVITSRADGFDWVIDGRSGRDIISYKILKPNKHRRKPVEEKLDVEALIHRVAQDMGKSVAEFNFADVRPKGEPIRSSVADTSAGETQVSTSIPDTNPKKQYGVQSIPLSYWSSLASSYGALAFYNGALKYGKANYANTPVEASIYIDGAMRHLAAWVAGEEFDPADNVPNLGGVLANIGILLEARAAGTLIDDRAKQSGYLKERDSLKEVVKHLNQLHEGKTPKHYTLGDN